MKATELKPGDMAQDEDGCKLVVRHSGERADVYGSSGIFRGCVDLTEIPGLWHPLGKITPLESLKRYVMSQIILDAQGCPSVEFTEHEEGPLAKWDDLQGLSLTSGDADMIVELLANRDALQLEVSKLNTENGHLEADAKELTARVAELEEESNKWHAAYMKASDIAHGEGRKLTELAAELAQLRERLRIKEGEQIEGDYAKLLELEDEVKSLREPGA